MYYCDEEYAYELAFADVWCKNLVSINGEKPTMQYACKNPQAGPVLPFSFPPQSTITSTCVNNNSTGYVCQGSEGAICTDVATIGNVCQPVHEFPPIGKSCMSFCTNDGAYSGVARYNDTKCTGLVEVELTAVGCTAEFCTNSGVTCNGAGPLAEPLIPTLGSVQSQQMELTALHLRLSISPYRMYVSLVRCYHVQKEIHLQ